MEKRKGTCIGGKNIDLKLLLLFLVFEIGSGIYRLKGKKLLCGEVIGFDRLIL